MAATFTVEDGTGKTDANAYATIAEVQQYNDDYKADAVWDALATDALKEKHIRIATRYLDGLYGGSWKGVATNENQALDWPRAGVAKRFVYSYDSDEVPQALIDACAEAAILSANSEDLSPDLTSDGAIKRIKSELDVLKEEIEYSGASSPYKRYTDVTRLVRDLIQAGSGVARG